MLTPSLVSQHAGDRRLTYSVLACKFSLPVLRTSFDVFFLDLFDLFVGQLCSSISRAGVNTSASAFTFHVGHVVGMATKEQVVNAYTSWIVAMVTYACTFRNRSIVDCPAQSMGEPVFSLVPKGTVAIFGCWASPYDAFSVWLGFPIETFRSAFARHT